MFYNPSSETEDNEEDETNDPKDVDGIMNNRNMLASDTPIKSFLNMEKQDITNEKKLNMNILRVDASSKLNGEYFGILSTSLTIT